MMAPWLMTLIMLIMGLVLMGMVCTLLAVILSISLARTGNPRPVFGWGPRRSPRATAAFLFRTHCGAARRR